MDRFTQSLSKIFKAAPLQAPCLGQIDIEATAFVTMPAAELRRLSFWNFADQFSKPPVESAALNTSRPISVRSAERGDADWKLVNHAGCQRDSHWCKKNIHQQKQPEWRVDVTPNICRLWSCDNWPLLITQKIKVIFRRKKDFSET